MPHTCAVSACDVFPGVQPSANCLSTWVHTSHRGGPSGETDLLSESYPVALLGRNAVLRRCLLILHSTPTTWKKEMLVKCMLIPVRRVTCRKVCVGQTQEQSVGLFWGPKSWVQVENGLLSRTGPLKITEQGRTHEVKYTTTGCGTGRKGSTTPSFGNNSLRRSGLLLTWVCYVEECVQDQENATATE